jgi:Flp pilus assembly protein TadG
MKLSRLIKSERGQAIVETALIMPLLLMMLMGMVEMGRLSNAYLAVTHAARHGARYGAVGGSNSEIIDKVKYAAVPLNVDNLSVTISPETNRLTGNDLSITVAYPIELIIPVFSGLVNPVNVKSTVIMRVE